MGLAIILMDVQLSILEPSMQKSRQGRTRSQPAKAGRSKDMKSQEFPGVGHYRDRHGKLRWRYRHKGFTVNLGTDYGSPEFLRRYNAAVKGERLSAEEATRGISQAPSGRLPQLENGQHSLSELLDRWYKSAQFTRLSDSTRRDYSLVAENLRTEHGDAPIEELGRGVILKLMQQKADRPEAANKLLRILRLILDHAMNVEEWIEANPAREVKKFAPKSSAGYHTWTDDEIDQYFKTHPEGTTADLAMALMLYTGAARADAVQLGPDNIQGGRLRYQRQKMKTRDGIVVDIPIHPDLNRRLTRLTPQSTFLEVARGKQRSAAGLGNAMRKWADKAGLPDCTAHGLRKACARRLAEAGATPHEIMAVTGHKTLAEVERYTAKVSRAGLADAAMNKQNGGKSG